MTTSRFLRSIAPFVFSLMLLGAGCSTEKTMTPSPSPAVQATTTTSYTLTDVATHKDSSSCWTVVQGNVYDVTAWIGRHPGGEQAIRSMCGQDATQAFTDQHDGQRRPENELASFQIGTLK